LPELTHPALVAALAALARRCLGGDRQALIAAEVAIAKAYGLGRNSFGRILEMFPKLEAREKDSLLAPSIWSRKAKDVSHGR